MHLQVSPLSRTLPLLDSRPGPQASTALYPDFALGALPHVEAVVAAEVQAALLALSPNSSAARLGGYDSFQPPLSFSTVRDVLHDVGVLVRNVSAGRDACIRVRTSTPNSPRVPLLT